MNPLIKIHVLHCGRVRIDRALPFKEDTLHPLAYTGWFRNPVFKIWLPVCSFLIEHPKGLVLVDTGWHADVRVDQEEYMGGFHLSLNRAELPEGQAVHEQLAQRGIKTSDLDYVVVSHLHSDHGGGLKHVRDAKNILVSDIEYRNGDRSRKMWADINFKTYEFEDSEYGPKKKAYDLFKDGSILLVHTPGHTAGVVSVLVQANGKSFLMFADCGYARKSWEEMIGPGIAWDMEQAMTSLEWIRKISMQASCVESLAAHQSPGAHTIEL